MRPVDSPDPADLDLVELLPLLERRELSAVELVEACSARVDRLEPVVSAFVLRTDDRALEAARAADRARARGDPAGPLAGVPVGVKDMVHVTGVPTTASSRVLDDLVPDTDATVWRRLRAAGAGLLGKTRTHEFAYGTSCPPTRNPWDPTRNPGGSSGGSAAALAARMLPVALGTDTGGSLRIPAAVCGLSSMRATPGRVPRTGVLPLADSLDVVGALARRMRDVALLHGLLAGPDPGDPTSLPAAGDRPRPLADLRGVRVGVLDPDGTSDGTAAVDDDIAAGCRDGLARLAGLGAELVPVEPPPSAAQVLARPRGVYEVLLWAEAAAAHRRLRAERGDRYDPVTRDRIDLGYDVTAVDYLDAQQLRAVWTREWRALVDRERLDVVASPTVPAPPGPQVASLALEHGVPTTLTKGWSVAGFPCVSVPVGLDRRGLPVGLQLAARPLAEARLLEVAIALDEAVRFFDRVPPLVRG